ncbi:MAG: hypothetical protein M3513_16905 [Actinomycetota bacterium]|nr:hypothetical protein [Actinomycetota bacterium]
MDITIHNTFLPHNDPDASLAFYRTLATPDIGVTFAKLEASGADIVQEPIEQPYGVRDCAVRDPAGNLIRINEVR